MIDLLELHKYFILKHLHEGDVAVDFTMGNGHDTEFLSKTVGPEGFVYAFDIQEQALASTQEHLVKVGCPDNYQLILDSHSNVKKYVDVPFKAGMFNLGWLPGGDKSITTLRETTLPAIHEADGITDGGEGGLTEGGDGLVSAGEPAQVEHTRLEGDVHVLLEVGVGVQDELVVIGAARLHQMLLGGGQGLLLDVEGVDEALGAHGLGEEFGVVAVTHGEIHRHVAGL